MISGKKRSSCFREEDVSRTEILYMYIAQGQVLTTLGDKILVVTERIWYFDHTL